MYISIVIMMLLSHQCISAIKQSASSPYTFSKSLKTITLTVAQKLYLDLLNTRTASLVVSHGPAGCGKTMLACSAAVKHFREGAVKKIVLTRPVISVSEENIGFLPGNINTKMDPWMRPLLDALGEHYTTKEINTLIRDGHIEIAPLGFMRGRTFKNAWIVADEMQNSTISQMKMLLTRLGENSRIIVTGDLEQFDRTGPYNGLDDFLSKLRGKRSDSISSFEFDREDIQREDVVKEVLEIYAAYDVPANYIASPSSD
jgi:phosphate starvation-inducible PhoH-like protein